MPNNSFENKIEGENYNEENFEDFNDFEQYHEIEYGDQFTDQDDDSNNQQKQNTHDLDDINTKNQTLPPKQIDPVEMFMQMISTGFTPTPAQISNATSNLSGPTNSSDTWFAHLLLKILKKRRKQKNT